VADEQGSGSALAKASSESARRIREKLKRELGPLILGLLADDSVVEVMLNPSRDGGPGELWVDRLGRPMELVGHMSASQAESLMATVASTLKTAITASEPILECELPFDGSRFEALIPPVVASPTFAIRKKALQVFDLADYVARGIMTGEQRSAIERAVAARRNILVVGGTSTGKTTLTNAIIRHIAAADPHSRIVIIEDTAELQCTAKNAVILRSTDHADMTRLLKATMRLRPDRILVGEVRDGAALALLKAWNTGHPGGVATVHANDAAAGLIRLEQLVAEATLAPMTALISEAVDLLVCIERDENSPAGRRIREVLEVTGHDGPHYLTRSAIINTEGEIP